MLPVTDTFILSKGKKFKNFSKTLIPKCTFHILYLFVILMLSNQDKMSKHFCGILTRAKG